MLALLGAGGAAAVAAAVGTDTPAQAAHDATNVFHVGEVNTAVPGAQTTLAANVNEIGLAALNPNSGDFAGIAGLASTLVVASSSQDSAAARLRDRLRDLRFFMKDGLSAQGVLGSGIGVIGLGDLAGVLGQGFFGVYGFGAVGVLGASETSASGDPGVAGALAAGPGIFGAGGTAPGVSGVSRTAAGVRGEGKTGVRGHASGSGKTGVHATAANRAVALKVEGGPMILPKLSTAQRNALSAVNGMLIYNNTVHRVQARVNGHWVNL
jgi:hypothetical protein